MTNVNFIKKYLKILCFFIIITAVFPDEAFAYLDPGTGSMVIQAIVAAIAAVTCTYKIWYSKIIALFNKKKDDKGENIDEN